MERILIPENMISFIKTSWVSLSMTENEIRSSLWSSDSVKDVTNENGPEDYWRKSVK